MRAGGDADQREGEKARAAEVSSLNRLTCSRDLLPQHQNPLRLRRCTRRHVWSRHNRRVQLCAHTQMCLQLELQVSSLIALGLLSHAYQQSR